MMFEYKCPVCHKIQESSEPPVFIHFCAYCGKADIPLYSANLYYVKPEKIIKICESELLRRKKGEPVCVHYIWTDRNGKDCDISKLSLGHIKGIMGMMKKMTPKKG